MTLTQTEIDSFFDDHLPYKLTQLKTHHYYKDELIQVLSGSPLQRKYEICAIEISFVAGRLFLDFLGLKYDYKKNQLVEHRKFKPDDVSVIDLAGQFVDINTLTQNEINILQIFYNRGNKGAAHLTWEKRQVDGWQYLDDGVEIIIRLLEENLFLYCNKPMVEK
jgi:hypothetical protein